MSQKFEYRDFPSTSPIFVCLLVFLLVGCATVQDAAREAVSEAAGSAIEERVEGLVAEYSDVMLYQLAYSQAFHLGGFGVGLEHFSEGEGTTWEVQSVDAEDMRSFRSERALLERSPEGSSWWYLRYDMSDEQAIEFEILHDANMIAQEMYVRNPNTGEIRRQEFDFDPVSEEELEATEDEIDEQDYRTTYTHLENYGEYSHASETLQVRAGTYNTDVLTYTDPEAEEDIEFRWWVSEDMPGFLVQFEMRDDSGQEMLRGEVIEHRQDYSRSFSL